MKIFLRTWLVAAIIFFPFLSYSQSTGSLDRRFNPEDFRRLAKYNTADHRFSGVVQLKNGRMLVAASLIPDEPSQKLIVLDSLGLRDTTIDLSARLPPDTGGYETQINCLHVFPNGKILVGGWLRYYNGSPVKGLIRLNPDFSLDPTFQNNSITTGIIKQLKVQDDGKIIIAGYFSTVGGQPHKHIARLLANGQVDPSFTSGTGFTIWPAESLTFNSIETLNNGKIVVGGVFDMYQDLSRENFIALNPDGSEDINFPYEGKHLDGVTDIKKLKDGSLLVDSWNDFSPDVLGLPVYRSLIKRKPSGSLDTSFKPKGAFFTQYGQVSSIVVLSSGNIFVTGNATIPLHSPTEKGYGFAKIFPDGRADTSAYPYGIDSYAFNVTKFVRVGNDDVVGISTGPNISNLTIRGPLFRMDSSGKIREKVFRHTGILPPVGYTNVSFLEVRDTSVIMAGRIYGYNSLYHYNGTGESGCTMARFNLKGQEDTSFVPKQSHFWRSQNYSFIKRILPLGDTGYMVCGEFDRHGNVLGVRGIARIRKSGELDPLFPKDLIGNNMQIAWMEPVADGKILIGGSFTSYKGISRPGLARIYTNGELDLTFVPPSNQGGVRYFGLQPDGKIVCSGNLGLWGTGRRIFRLNPDGTLDSSFANAAWNSTSFDINNLIFDKQGRIYLAGQFDDYNGIQRGGILRLKPNGTLDSAYNPINGPTGGTFIRDIMLQPDGKLVALCYYSSQFVTRSNVTRKICFRFFPDGSLDTSMNANGMFHPTENYNLGQLPQKVSKEGQLFVGGTFSRIEGVQRLGIAALHLNVYEQEETNRKLKGEIFIGLNNNCIREANEKLLPGFIVKGEPGPNYSLSDSSGRYVLSLDSGQSQVNTILNTYQKKLFDLSCPANAPVSVSFLANPADSIRQQNFALQSLNCPFLRVAFNSGIRRPCWKGTSPIRIENMGPVPSQPCTLHVKLPRFGYLVGSPLPAVLDPVDSVYKIEIGSIPGLTARTITIQDSIACLVSLRGTEFCASAWVTPGNTCIPNPPGWDGVDLKVEGFCSSATPSFKIRNTGSAMTAPRSYRVYIDSLLVLSNNFMLGSQDSISFMVPSFPLSWVRVEVNQSNGHPWETFTAADASCGTFYPRGRSYFASPDESPVMATDCQIIRASYDPNDKTVWPAGSTAEGRVSPNRWFDYRIRFQNTGNDTAFHVTLVDTLDPALDLSTLEIGSASHPFTYTIDGHHQTVLKFRFGNILLPDSFTNSTGSNGFVNFRIKHLAGLASGTRIRNFADIYFDFNPPVRTNSTLNTLWEESITPGILDSVLVLGGQGYVTQDISIVPNPSTGRVRFVFPGGNEVCLFNTSGQKLVSSALADIVSDKGYAIWETDLSGYRKGLYFATFSGRSGTKVKKIILE